MSKKIYAFLLVLCLVLSACAAAPKSTTPVRDSANESKSLVAPGAPAVGVAPAPMATAASKTSAGDGNVQSSLNGTTNTRLVIKNATLVIVVDDPNVAMDSIIKMAEEMGGFVVTSALRKVQTGEGIEVPEATVSVRVPAEKLDEALGTIHKLVKDPKQDILSENTTGDDVTDKYTDLKSRLTNLENAEKQLQKIMDSATKTDDVLSVYNRLIQIREQIEVIKGQMKYYEQSAALSLINTTIKAKESVKPITVAGWQPAGVALSAIQALINTLKFLANAAIWIVLFIVPVILLIYIPIRLLWAGFKRIRKNRKHAAPPAIPPAVNNIPPTAPGS